MKILIQTREGWETVDAKVYDDESELQRLLMESPEVIPSDAEAGSGPIVWCREFSTQAGPIDLLGVGADGSITVMECKLARNQEIRRKVVGQVLDYASALWELSTADLEQEFSRREGEGPFDRLQRLASDENPDWNAEECREEAAARLSSGSFRLLIAVDELDANLKRIIRYVNAQGSGERRLKLVALAFPRYTHPAVQILVPETYGDEAPATVASSQQVRPPIQWNADRFFPLMASEDRSVAEKLLAWIENSTARVDWGRGAVTGSFAAHVDANDRSNPIFSVGTDGRVWLKFGDLRHRPPFDDRSLRQEFARRVNLVDGMLVGDDKLEKFPSYPLAVLVPPPAFKAFTDSMSWAIVQFARTEGTRA